MPDILINMITQKRKKICSTRLHESNYVKLLLVVPSIRYLATFANMSLKLGNQINRITIKERSKYTTTAALELRNIQNNSSPPLLQELSLTIRLYHDAHVAEILSFQNHRRFQPKYDYPNQRMYHKNEKQQLNHFLEEWLDFCISQRYIFHEDVEPLNIG